MEGQVFDSARTAIATYLLDNVEEYQCLTQLRKQGWDNPAGDVHFTLQRNRADKPNAGQNQFFFNMMLRISKELDAATSVFELDSLPSTASYPKLLDMCAAPGVFLLAALRKYPGASAAAFTLPVEAGGHEVSHLASHPRIDLKLFDITMLAGDMGVDVPALPQDHPDRAAFLPKQLVDDRIYSIAICDGKALRTHDRADYREHREARSLLMTQLALALEHLVDGGTMLVLLHKPEYPDTLESLHKFCQFSTVQLFKPAKNHANRSSFYMVAKGVQVNHPVAVQAVKDWKETCKIATFGSKEEYEEHVRRDSEWAEKMLEEFGEIFVEMSRPIWDIQARALKRESWTK